MQALLPKHSETVTLPSYSCNYTSASANDTHRAAIVILTACEGSNSKTDGLELVLSNLHDAIAPLISETF